MPHELKHSGNPPTPVVLVGGRSRRFGRDKLLEPIANSDNLLVDQPIRALREAFESAVAVVGDCHPKVAARADFVIDDPYPGVGPIGGVLAALKHARQDIFVLSGDLPHIDAHTVRSITTKAADHPSAWAVIARTEVLHPTIGIYRHECTDLLLDHVTAGRLALRNAIPRDHRLEVNIDPLTATNVNRPCDF